MKKNVGAIDKVIRIFIAIIVGVLYSQNIISGTIAIILGLLAIILVITSFLSFCPLYLPFGISTFRKNKNE